MPSHLLVIMGSGETTPTMVTPHQRVLATLGPSPRAVLLDTPYGFQENADELSAKSVEYFGHNVGTSVDVVSLRRVETASSVEVERAQAAVADADWVFIGPGSPSYLVRQLAATRIPQLLRERITTGHGVTVVSSAAAATIGTHAVPVYEIYKAGQEPAWVDGLALLPALGLDAVLVPHFDNAEGGTHDTRYCYLGERRLQLMEQELPDGTWVLGVDEHTSVVIDLTSEEVRVQGRGGLTVRRRDGSTWVVPTGGSTTLTELRATAEGHGGAMARQPARAGQDGQDTPHPADPNAAPLMEAVTRARATFADATARKDAAGATQAVLDLERTMRDWQADTQTGDLRERSVAALRGLVTRLGDLADGGLADPADAVAPFVSLLLYERTAAREAGDWAAADRIRDGLTAAGVVLADGPDGTTWTLEEPE